jgi:hypothetical protein
VRQETLVLFYLIFHSIYNNREMRTGGSAATHDTIVLGAGAAGLTAAAFAAGEICIFPKHRMKNSKQSTIVRK